MVTSSNLKLTQRERETMCVFVGGRERKRERKGVGVATMFTIAFRLQVYIFKKNRHQFFNH